MKTVIFGCGKDGINYFNENCVDVNDVVFYDNDRRKWGNEIRGTQIINLAAFREIIRNEDYRVILTIPRENAKYFLKDIGAMSSKVFNVVGERVEIDHLSEFSFDIEKIEMQKLKEYEKTIELYRLEGKKNAYEHGARYIQFKKQNFYSPEIEGIELTNFCNLNCPNCPTPHCQREKGYMSDKVFDKCLEYVPPRMDVFFSMHGLGEPLLHPKFEIYLKELAETGVPILISTNGLLFDESTAEMIFDVIEEFGKGKIFVSFHTSKSVENWYRALKLLKKKDYHNVEYFGQVLEHNQNDALRWLRDIGVVDAENNPNIRFISSHSFAGNVAARRKNYEEIEVHNRFRNCYFAKNNISSVAWDGRLKGCCLDAELAAGVGNIFELEKSRLSDRPYELCNHCDPDWTTGYQ